MVHTGRFALSDSAVDIRPFLAALRQANCNSHQIPIKLHLLGEYSKRELSRMGDLINEGKIVIYPLMGRRETLAYQKAADLLLLITRPGVRSGIPLKLFEYLFSGKPVLAVTDDLEIRRIVNESKTGWCVSPLDAPALAALLERILADPGFHPIPEYRPAVINGFSWKKQMQELERLLASLL
jgi:glycosyltransferase involved in cell wall biosynthesis